MKGGVPCVVEFSMETVLDLVGAKTRGKVTRAVEIEVQCPHGVCGHKKQPIYFSVNLAKGQYNCFHCCSGCPYSGGMIDLYCMFTGLDPNNKKEVKKALLRLWMEQLSRYARRPLRNVNSHPFWKLNRMRNSIRYTEPF